MSLVSKNSILDITDILNEYSEDIQEAMKHNADLVSKLGVNKLKSNSPKKTGKYAKGWKVKNESGRDYIKLVIYNTNPGLTQLLEKPHVIRNKHGEWGTYNPQKSGTVHIKPVEDIVKKDYEKAIVRAIKNGGQ